MVVGKKTMVGNKNFEKNELNSKADCCTLFTLFHFYSTHQVFILISELFNESFQNDGSLNEKRYIEKLDIIKIKHRTHYTIPIMNY